MEKRFSQLGYHSIILLHDPRKKEGTIETPPDGYAEAEEVAEPVLVETKVFDVNKAKIAEMKEYIAKNKIPHSPTDKKKDLKIRIKEWQNK